MIVEDGTGLTDADSYVSVDFADNYFSARGVSGWNDLEAETKEQFLIRATDFIDNIFQWHGRKLAAGQALRFPRTNVFDYEGTEIIGIPMSLKQSVCDVAIEASTGAELFQKSEVNGDVVSESITSLSFTYSSGEKKIVSRTLYDSVNTKLRGLYVDNTIPRIQMGRMYR